MCTVSTCENCLLGSFFISNIVLTKNVVHLLLSPLAPLTRLTIVLVLVINKTDHLHSGIVTAASPLIEISKTAFCLELLPCLKALAYTVIIPEIIEYVLVLSLCVSDFLNEVKFWVLLINCSPHNTCTAPHIVPAVAPARRSIVIKYLNSVIKYACIACCKIHPSSSPAVVIFPLC